MILQALTRYYDILVDDPDTEIAPFGYSTVGVSFALNLSAEGELLDILPQFSQVQRGKKMVEVPLPMVLRQSNMSAPTRRRQRRLQRSSGGAISHRLCSTCRPATGPQASAASPACRTGSPNLRRPLKRRSVMQKFWDAERSIVWPVFNRPVSIRKFWKTRLSAISVTLRNVWRIPELPLSSSPSTLATYPDISSPTPIRPSGSWTGSGIPTC